MDKRNAGDIRTDSPPATVVWLTDDYVLDPISSSCLAEQQARNWLHIHPSFSFLVTIVLTSWGTVISIAMASSQLCCQLADCCTS